MNSQMRATAHIKADAAQPAPLILSHTEATLADMRRDDAMPERHTAGLVPLDIAAARMRALAGRITDARHDARQLAVLDDATLENADTEILPVSRSAIAGLRAFRAVTADEDFKPAPVAVVAQLAVSSEPEIASGVYRSEVVPPSPPPATIDAEALPVPLRRAGTQLDRFTSVPKPTDVEFEARSTDGSQLPAVFNSADQNSALEPLENQIAPASEDGEMLPADIRLVDLVRRQQTLLDQLSSYHGPSTPADAVQSLEPPQFATPSVVEQLAPVPLPLAPSQLAPAQLPPPAEARRDVSETPTQPSETAMAPHVPSTFAPRLGVPQDDSDSQLPERSPMIIERARAERQGRYGANEKYTPPSAIPAFAAGISVAIAIAGTLFYLL